MAAGPGLVLLVGGPGSGKTFTLLAYAGGASQPVGLRSVDDPLHPGTAADLVDNVHAKAAARLMPFRGTRALAVEPKLAERLVLAFPRARIVTVQPMLSRDVHVMVEVRLRQLGLPAGHLTSRALARMDELCCGNPRQLDALLFRSLRLAAAAAAARVSLGHVEQATLQVAMEAVGVGQALGSVEREAALRLLGRSEAPVGFDQPRRRASAPDFWASSLDAQRNLQTAPAASTWPLGKLAVVPRWPRRPAPLVTSARKAGARKAGNTKFFAMNPADAAQAGSRGRRPGFKTLALAAVVVAACVVTAPNVLEMSGWAANWAATDGQAGPVDTSATVASLPPQTATPGPMGAVPSPAPAAKAVPLTSVPSHGKRLDPVAPQGAMGGTVPRAVPSPHRVASPRQMADAASILAPVPDAAAPSQAVAATSAAEAPPGPEPAAGPSPAAVQGTAKEAARLFSLGKALLAINQGDDARLLLRTSANMGNSKAAALLAAYDTEDQGSHAQAGPTQAERASAHGTPAVRAAPKPGRQGPPP